MSEKNNVKKMSSTKKIFYGMLLGLLVGIGLHYVLPKGYVKETIFVNGIFYLLGQGFVRALQMLVVPLVFFSITTGVMQMKDVSRFGRVAVRTLVLFFVTTTVGIIFALFTSYLFKQGIGMSLSGISKSEISTQEAPTIIETLVNIIPKNPIGSLANGEMLQIIFWAFITGVVCGRFSDDLKPLVTLIETGNTFMMKVTEVIMKVAPIGVFALIARTFTDVGLDIVGPLLKFLAAVIVAMILLALIIYTPLVMISTKSSPKQFFKKIAPVYTFAFSSASSNATIPLTLESCDTMGIPREISSFTIPLGATVNMDGTAIYQGCAVIFIANAFGIELSTSALLTVVITAVLSSVGTAGVPGSGMIMLSMVLTSVGLPVEGVSLIMSVERIVDMFRTALNVTGDVVATIFSAGRENMFDKEKYLSDEVTKSKN